MAVGRVRRQEPGGHVDLRSVTARLGRLTARRRYNVARALIRHSAAGDGPRRRLACYRRWYLADKARARSFGRSLGSEAHAELDVPG